MVFHWSLNESKSPQVSRTLLCILAVLNNVVVWMVSTRPPNSKSSSLFSNPLVTVPNAPITIGIFFQFYSVVNRDSKVDNFTNSLSIIIIIIIVVVVVVILTLDGFFTLFLTCSFSLKSESPQISRTIPSIRLILSAVVCTILILSLILNSPCIFSRHLEKTVSRVPTTTGNTVTFILRDLFSSRARSKYLSIFWLFFSFIFLI